MKKKNHAKIWCRLLGLLLIAVPTLAQADDRHFTYVYEADSVLPKGKAEYEQWITYRTIKQSGNYSAWDFSSEIEYGFADRITGALYLNTSFTHAESVPGMADEDTFEFEGIATEWKFQLSSPYLNPIGILMYAEISFNGHELELEPKLVLQHNFGKRWIWAFNVAPEHEMEFSPAGDEQELKLEISTGLSFLINENWSLGVEARSHSIFPEYSSHEATAIYVGPNAHYENSRWWATFSVLPQIYGSPNTESHHELVEHEGLESRLILGVNF